MNPRTGTREQKRSQPIRLADPELVHPPQARDEMIVAFEQPAIIVDEKEGRRRLTAMSFQNSIAQRQCLSHSIAVIAESAVPYRAPVADCDAKLLPEIRCADLVVRVLTVENGRRVVVEQSAARHREESQPP